jgi:pimeloyl-ACP methyl ester carboxylesterase
VSALRRISGTVGIALLGLAVSSSAAGGTSLDPSPVRHVTINGAPFGYRTIGHGPPLVMIMGFTGTMAEWDPALIERLSARYRVILFDNRGVAESADASVAGLTIESMARDTARLISELTARGKAHVLGWSMGSYIGEELALRHPSRLRRLVLAGSDPGSPRAI